MALAALCCAGTDVRAAPLTLALAGDVSLARGAVRVHQQAWAQVFAPLRPALGADVTFANLESPLTGAGRQGNGLDLRAPPDAAVALAPFSHLGVENNHALDGGEAGRRQVLRLLSAHGVSAVERSPHVQTVQGQRLVWLAFLDDGASPLPLKELRAARRAAGPDGLVIAAPHWGQEYRGVSGRQRAVARQLAQAGADLIVGSGPHVLQESGRVGGALVFYSLGNLLFDQPYPATWPGAVVRVTRTRPGAALQACAVPTFSRAGRVRLASPEESAHILARLNLPDCTGQP